MTNLPDVGTQPTCETERETISTPALSMGCVRSRWCVTHHRWEYDFPVRVCYTWNDGSETVTDIRGNKL